MNSILSLFQKEIASFLNSLVGYIVMTVFLTGVGMFFWLFPGNILESGYAEMDALFIYGPYFFLFLVPAITMRSFAEEVRTGTLEFLATKPITDWQIILGKYLAAVFLVLFSLLPTLVYYISVHSLGSPVGNLDTGATLGAYIGLFSLGCIFAGIGVFTSSLTDNQVVSFILGVFSCFVFFLSFDLLAQLDGLAGINKSLSGISIMHHYQSISRGVVDTRDLLYFISFIAITLVLTKLVLMWRRG